MTRSPLKRKRSASNFDIDYPLKKVFQKQAFRPLQREIINAVLDGHDIFVQAATSFGKSLCFQLPAWCSKGVTVVISPLLALVQNQVNAANNFGLTTHSITSNTPTTQRKEIEADLQCGHPHTRLLYVTPELCTKEPFRKVLRRLHQQGQLYVLRSTRHIASQNGDTTLDPASRHWTSSSAHSPMCQCCAARLLPLGG